MSSCTYCERRYDGPGPAYCAECGHPRDLPLLNPGLRSSGRQVYTDIRVYLNGIPLLEEVAPVDTCKTCGQGTLRNGIVSMSNECCAVYFYGWRSFAHDAWLVYGAVYAPEAVRRVVRKLPPPS